MSISLPVFCALFGILTDIVNFPVNVGFEISEVILDTILGGCPVVFLYASIALFIRGQLRLLKSTGSNTTVEDSLNHIQTIVESLIFSIVLILYGGSTILQGLLQHDSTATSSQLIGQENASEAEDREYNITFWAAYVFLAFATINVFISASLTSSRLKAKVETE